MGELKIRRFIGYFLLFKLVFFGLGFLVFALMSKPEGKFSDFFQAFFHWDVAHVMSVVHYGYNAEVPEIQIFPLLPILIAGLARILRDPYFSAFIVAQVASFFHFYFFYRLARLKLTEHQAQVALLLYAVFPTSYFLHLPYMEAVFGACAMASLYFLQLGRPFSAATAACLAVLSRMNGFFLGPSLLLAALVERSKWKRKDWGHLGIYLIGSLAGILCYLSLNHYVHGNFLFFIENQSRWNVHLSYPFSGLWSALQGFGHRVLHEQVTLVFMQIVFVLAALWGCAVLIKRKSVFESFFVGLNLLLFISLDFWMSQPRFVMILFPLFFPLGLWASKSTGRICVFVSLSLPAYFIFFGRFLSGQWAF